MPRQRRRSREKWQELVAGLKKSGLSRRRFAAERGVNWRTLENWFYRLQRERRPTKRPAAAVRFLPVRVPPDTAGATARQLGAMALEAMVGKVRLRFDAGVDCDYVGRLLVALERHGAC